MAKSLLHITGSSSPGSGNSTEDSDRGAGAAGKGSHKLQLEAGRGGGSVQIYVTTALSEVEPQSGVLNMVTGKITDQGLGAANGGSKTPSAVSHGGGNGKLCGKRKAEGSLEQV